MARSRFGVMAVVAGALAVFCGLPADRSGAGTTVSTTVVTRSESVPPAPAPATGGEPTQVIKVYIKGGSMSVSPDLVRVVLHRYGRSRYVGRYGPLEVVDARGNLAGWVTSLRLLSGAAGVARVVVNPDTPRAVTGYGGDVEASPSSYVGPGGSVPIMRASPGGGGGAFTDAGTVDVDGLHGGSIATLAFGVAVQ